MSDTKRGIVRRTSAVSLFFVLLFGGAATPSEGQLNLNLGAAYAEALDGQWGIEARIDSYPLAMPMTLFAGGEYFFASCDEDCGLWGWRVGGLIRSTTPGFQPFLSGAWVGREWERGERELSETGISLGVGFRITVWKLGIRAEASREFLGGDLDQWVFRLGTG
jgi:hypothetical protein